MQLWETSGLEWKFVWCGVGSRDVPDDIRKAQVWIGHCLALLGGVLRTGDAIGSDYNFMAGYVEGKSNNMPPPQIYYTRLKNQRNLPHDPQKGYHEAEQYSTHEQSKAIAFKARGSFEGLFPSGIGLHSRNPMQVLSETLENPCWLLVFYAKPVGKRGLVSGGTNTAVQVAVMHGVRKVNLYVDEDRERLIDWITAQLTKKGIPVPTMEQL
ncbi:hypothetical protein D3C85_15020 [compost metagenome]